MKLAEWKELLFQEMKNAVANPEFRLKKSERYVRKMPGGKQTLHIVYWDRYSSSHSPSVLWFEWTLWRRFFTVSLVFPKNANAPPKPFMRSGSFLKRKRLTYDLASAEEMSSLFVRLSKLIRAKMIPFFDKYRDLQSIDSLINSNGGRAVYSMDTPPWSAMQSLIVAHLAKNPRFHEVVEEKKRQAEFSPQREWVSRFMDLVDYLRLQQRG
jgi:hypothetical protein